MVVRQQTLQSQLVLETAQMDSQLDRNEGLPVTVNSVSSQKDTVYHDKTIMTNNINWNLCHKIKNAAGCGTGQEK